MADKKISQLSAATTPLAGTEVLPVVQGGSTVKVSAADVTAGRAVSALTYTSTATTGTAPFTVSSTTQVANLNAATAGTASNLLSNATTGVLQVTGPGTGTTRVMTTPNANFTVARTDAANAFSGTQSITNDTADTNTAVNVLTLTQSSTGTAAAGLGAGVLFKSERPSGGLILDRGAVYGVSGPDANDDGYLAFYTLTSTGPGDFTEKWRITSAGDLQATANGGNVVIGVVGKGIDFSVNGGDVLTQYNQGTWTPADASGAGLTFTNSGAAFTQIGNVVTINMEIVWPVTANGSAAKVTLPFAPAAGTRAGVGAMSNAGVVNFYIPGSINAALYDNAGATISNATMSGKYLIVAISYLL